MRDEERAGHLHEWKTSEKTSLTNATMPRKLIGSVLVRWTVQRSIEFQRGNMGKDDALRSNYTLQYTDTIPHRSVGIFYTRGFEVEEIRRLLELCNGRVTQIFKEGNR